MTIDRKYVSVLLAVMAGMVYASGVLAAAPAADVTAPKPRAAIVDPQAPFVFKTVTFNTTDGPCIDFKQTTEPQAAEFFLWLPPDLKKAQGLVMVSLHGSGQSLYVEPELRKLAKDLNLGLVGLIGDGVQRGFPASSILFKALEELGRQSGHPEIVNAPMFVFGMSNGSGFAGGLACLEPGRVFGWVLYHPGGYKQIARPGLYNIPGMVVCGEKDNRHAALVPEGNDEKAIKKFQQYGQQLAVERARKENNALMQLVVEPGVGHGHNASKSWTIVLAFIKTLFALRVPQDADLAKGPVKLKAIKEADGWLGQNWNAQTGGYQKLPIAAYADFSGDKAQASWLPTADYARQWQEFQNAGFIERW